MSDLTSLATGLPSTRRVLVLSVHFHFDEMATVSRRQPPKPLPICEEPHNGVPTRSDEGRQKYKGSRFTARSLVSLGQMWVT
jgi:hypothetical protein